MYIDITELLVLQCISMIRLFLNIVMYIRMYVYKDYCTASRIVPNIFARVIVIFTQIDQKFQIGSRINLLHIDFSYRFGTYKETVFLIQILFSFFWSDFFQDTSFSYVRNVLRYLVGDYQKLYFSIFLSIIFEFRLNSGNVNISRLLN